MLCLAGWRGASVVSTARLWSLLSLPQPPLSRLHSRPDNTFPWTCFLENMFCLKNVPRRGTSHVTRLPLGPCEGARDGELRPGDSRDTRASLGLQPAGQSSTCVWKFDLTRASPQAVSFSAMDGAFPRGLRVLWDPRSPSLVPWTCGRSWVSPFPASPASREPCGQDPAFLQTRRPRQHQQTAEARTRLSGVSPVPASQGTRGGGGEGPGEKPSTEGQSSGDSCVSGGSKKAQVRVTVTRGSLCPGLRRPASARCAEAAEPCAQPPWESWPSRAASPLPVLLSDGICGGKNSSFSLRGRDE